MAGMSQAADEPESDVDEPPEGTVFSDDPKIDDAIWETIQSDFTADDW